MKTDKPTLPAVFTLEVAEPDASDAGAACAALAEQGRDEGTVVWIEKTRLTHGGFWHNAEDNLDCAILLRPEFTLAKTQQLLIVASLSMGNAIATFASPMTPMEFAWPNDIVMAGMKIGAIDLQVPNHTELNDHPAWAVLRACVNVNHYPQDIDQAISIKTMEGTISFSVGDLLAEFCRRFLGAINDWDEFGLAKMLTNYTPRMVKGSDILTRRAAICVANDGTDDLQLNDCQFVEIADDGTLVLRINDNRYCKVTLDAWWHGRTSDYPA